MKAPAWIAATFLGAVLLTGASSGAASSTTWIVIAASPQHGTQPSQAPDGGPFWTLAPNGRTIAVIGPRPGPAGCQEVACEVSALYLVRFGATRQRRFADDAGLAGWSPDSRTLVFARRGTLNLQAASGGPAKVIAVGEPEENAPLGDAPPAWQP